jgi:hypothetical protein
MLVGDRSFSNFQKVRRRLARLPHSSQWRCPDELSPFQILDLKGTPKKQQNHLLDIFVSVTSVLDDLTETSFLSSLDMDAGGATVLANASAADRALLSPTGSGIGLSSMGLGSGSGGPGGEGPSAGRFSFFKNFGRKESSAS